MRFCGGAKIEELRLSVTMEFLAKRPNLLFLIAVRPRTTLYYSNKQKAIAGVNSIIEFPLPNLGLFMLRVSLIIPKFGRRFLKQYVKANIIKTHLTYSNKFRKYVLANKSYSPGNVDLWTINSKLHGNNKSAIIQYDLYPFVIQYYEYRKYGKLHRKNSNGPTVYIDDGTRKWFYKGLLHREYGPAVIKPDGTKEWRILGKLHREDGPAVIKPDGTKEWRILGKLHREDGPAVIKPDGTKEWRIFGILYTNAIVKQWWQNGSLHRTDGPAIVRSYDGVIAYEEWWQNGKETFSPKEKGAIYILMFVLCMVVLIVFD